MDNKQQLNLVTEENQGLERATTDMMISRQAQEVQAAMIVAKKFPRDENLAFARILKSCARVGLAEQAEYTYPRGGEKIVGASIRLAESIAQNWGNIDYGIIELENSNGKSDLMAYAWDLETNTRITKVFTVKHKRDTRQGSYALTDSRDIYEATANFGARRVRACILGIIPGDVIDAAVNECRKTIKGNNKSPIEDRIRTMLARFATDYMVTQEQIEKYLGCNIKGINENDLIKMLGVHRSISDGMSTPKDYFGSEGAPASAEVKEDPFQKKAREEKEAALRKKFKEEFPKEEDWQTDVRIKEALEAKQ